MSLINRLLFRFSGHLRCRVIRGANQQPYLERYHLLRLPFGIHVYLHRFVACDPGKALHNHPWRSAISLLLSGQYTETRLGHGRNHNPLLRKTVRAGQLNVISGNIYHRIDLPPGAQAWSLFIHSARHRSWGFLDTAQRRFCYTDHNRVVTTQSNPQWWRNAMRPKSSPGMRSALELPH